MSRYTTDRSLDRDIRIDMFHPVCPIATQFHNPTPGTLAAIPTVRSLAGEVTVTQRVARNKTMEMEFLAYCTGGERAIMWLHRCSYRIIEEGSYDATRCGADPNPSVWTALATKYPRLTRAAIHKLREEFANVMHRRMPIQRSVATTTGPPSTAAPTVPSKGLMSLPAEILLEIVDEVILDATTSVNAYSPGSGFPARSLTLPSLQKFSHTSQFFGATTAVEYWKMAKNALPLCQQARIYQHLFGLTTRKTERQILEEAGAGSHSVQTNTWDSFNAMDQVTCRCGASQVWVAHIYDQGQGSFVEVPEPLRSIFGLGGMSALPKPWTQSFNLQ